MFLIMCEQLVDGQILWWRKESRGYTTNVDEAGLYTERQARDIERIRGKDFAVDEKEIGEETLIPFGLRTETVVKTETGGNFAARTRIIWRSRFINHVIKILQRRVNTAHWNLDVARAIGTSMCDEREDTSIDPVQAAEQAVIDYPEDLPGEAL